MLPFDQNTGKGQIQCFVCGVAFSAGDFASYKSHILEKHEEGRDYVLCKCDWCLMPCRNLALHYKVKHKGQPIPKCQLKPIVWKDFSSRGKAKTKKPNYRDGDYHSVKMNTTFHYRSGYEEQVYNCLDSLVEVHAFAAEPFKIPYIFKGETHEYTPDILVSFMDGRKEVWEVKPANQTNLPVNKAKWAAAECACTLRGWKFLVITEQSIDKLKKQVNEQKIEM